MTSKVQSYILSVLENCWNFPEQDSASHTTHIPVSSLCAVLCLGELSQNLVNYLRELRELSLAFHWACSYLPGFKRADNCALLNFNSVTLCRVKQSLIITRSQDFQALPTYRKSVCVSENGDGISKSAQKKSLWTWNFKVFKTGSQLLWKCILGFINIWGS